MRDDDAADPPVGPPLAYASVRTERRLSAMEQETVEFAAEFLLPDGQCSLS